MSIGIAAALTGCIRRSPPLESTTKPRFLRWTPDGGVVCPSEAIARHPYLPPHACLTAGGLARLSAEPRAAPAAALATEWSDTEGARWRIRLREDAAWSDGVPLTADQVVESWRLMIQRCHDYGPAARLLGIVGARAYCEKRLPFDSVGVKAEGDRTIVVQWSQPAPWFPWLLAHPVTWPFRPSHPNAGLGPFLLVSDPRAPELRFYPNPRHAGGPPSLDGIVVGRRAQDASLRIQTFLSGETDLVDALPRESARPFAGDSRLRAFGGYRVAVVVFNPHRRPTDGASFRRALQQAVDPGEAITLHRWPHLPPPWTASFSAAGARKTLAALGLGPPRAELPAGLGPLRLQEEGPGAWIGELAENLVVQWQKHLGLKWTRGHSAGAAAAALVTIEMDPWQPVAVWRRFQQTHLDRWGRWRHRELESALDQAGAATTASEAISHLESVWRILVREEALVLPLLREADVALVSPRLGRLSRDALGHWNFRDVVWDQ